MTTPAHDTAVRNKSTVNGLEWPTLVPPVTIGPGDVGHLPREVALALDPLEWEILDEAVSDERDGIVLTRYTPVPIVSRTVLVTATSGGTVTMPDSTLYLFSHDGSELEMDREHAQFLIARFAEGFSSPDIDPPVVDGGTASEPSPPETAVQRKKRLAAEAPGDPA